YLKTNSIGEFVFDWDWAEACERAGMNYYPKLVSAVPFAPVAGARLLVRDDVVDQAQLRRSLIHAAVEIARKSGISGVHFLFPEAPDEEALAQQGCMIRRAFQYHWHNRQYERFDDFLEGLNSKRRKQIKKERAAVKTAGIEIEILHGSEISDRHWSTFQQFYTSTFHRKWGEPRLNLPFFQSLSRNLPQATLLFLARLHNKYIAGAFAMRNADTLYGRHWGCLDQYRFLHFELCYYQTIEYCIRQRLRVLDAGVQGEHKVHRGFLPAPVCSAHWIADGNLRRAIERYLNEERQLIMHHMQQLSLHSAYKQAHRPGVSHVEGALQKQ
ncbi:MAG: GNAT family N-acetyltransferase, partial [Gammaproteobacteria bacterium]